MTNAAEQNSPWAAFSGQSVLWGPDKLKSLAETCPDLAAQKLSLADVTDKDVADYYAQAGFEVEILTGNQGLCRLIMGCVDWQDKIPTTPVEAVFDALTFQCGIRGPLRQASGVGA